MKINFLIMSKQHEQNKKNLDFWLKAIKDVAPLGKKNHKSSKGDFSEKNIKRVSQQENRFTVSAPSLGQPKQINNFFRGKTPGLDRSTSENLRRGKIQIEGRLDLHGYGYMDGKLLFIYILAHFFFFFFLENHKIVFVPLLPCLYGFL